jgi:hypothetical protein
LEKIRVKALETRRANAAKREEKRIVQAKERILKESGKDLDQEKQKIKEEKWNKRKAEIVNEFKTMLASSNRWDKEHSSETSALKILASPSGTQNTMTSYKDSSSNQPRKPRHTNRVANTEGNSRQVRSKEKSRQKQWSYPSEHSESETTESEEEKVVRRKRSKLIPSEPEIQLCD